MSRSEHFHAARRGETYHDLPHQYDVSHALELVSGRAPSRTLDVTGLRSAIDFGRSVDPDHAMTTDVSMPLLIANHSPQLGKRPLLIDGWHRAYHASEQGMKELHAVELTPEETAQVMYTGRGMPREKGVMTHAQMMKKQRELA